MSKKKVGVVGTGFIAKGLILSLLKQDDLILTKILTRRSFDCCTFLDKEFFTNSIDELIDSVDLIIECSGDVIHATSVIDKAISASLPVITMNTEFHVTVGSYFVDKGIITEAEGDQPGCLASLKENALQMGFQPLVYGNIKGFLNHKPTLADMHFWSKKSGISLEQVVSFTDGTKVQMEQALVANGLGATIAVPGLVGKKIENDEDIKTLVDYVEDNIPISDYILSPKYPAGVFIIAKHDEKQREYLKYYKMGNGPYYILLNNFHLCHLEIIKTVRRILRDSNDILLNNSSKPLISVCSIAKRQFISGEIIQRAVGSFEFRGEAIKISENQNHVPIGLLVKARVIRNLEEGQIVTFDDVELPDSLALQIWKKICNT